MPASPARIEPDAPLHADPGAVLIIDTNTMEWQPSPSAGVLRKRLHRVGPVESGPVTSIVRYHPGAAFPAHDHPEGEEILVLDGVFSDEHGDWKAGTYLLNPAGFRHAPFSRDGCTIFVKLRQAPGSARAHEARTISDARWESGPWPGSESSPLHVPEGQPDASWLVRFRGEGDAGEVIHHRGVEMLVIDGRLRVEAGVHGPGTWLRFPVGHRHHLSSETSCLVYAKIGGLALLEQPAL